MLRLRGQYRVAPNKRLTIIADTHHLPKGTLAEDIDALTQACTQNAGACEVEVTTPHGLMRGTLTMKSATLLRRRTFEGSFAYLPRA
ncbi:MULTISPECIES: hypothetical protein [Deinococcus]|jgi:hypothetical protein|uniref:Uncharacterized protein n=1 Tax=Deinococcus enclensis TaxID=1049582 RepID=A0ABT9M8L6_9DEIO|nr:MULTISPECIES: hypothetical protein [Deinococcus]MDP9762910.1 hypothetical protein [Deinococcus enclensis]